VKRTELYLFLHEMFVSLRLLDLIGYRMELIPVFMMVVDPVSITDLEWGGGDQGNRSMFLCFTSCVTA
jgi:hypothetical protein